jgi:membrane peptidoglycan carboxypeptidase
VAARPGAGHREEMRAKRLLRLTLCGFVAGLLLAAATFPVAASTGLLARASIDTFSNLPDKLSIPPDPQASYVYANDGRTLITTFYDQNRHNVALSEVAPVMQQAIVAAEDSRFYQHGAVDFKGMARALVSDVARGRAEQGASTLTMQYVRNVLKNDAALTIRQRRAATANSPVRKLQEMRYAIALEGKLSKPEILERYLNIAYFGAGAYGIYAASGTYFGTTPDRLTLPQAAMIAGLVQAPDTDNPLTGDPRGARSRRAYVLQAMVRAGYITAAQATTTAPLGLHPTRQPNGCNAVPDSHDDWGFFCDYLRRWWDAQPAFGPTPAEREQTLLQGGYRIVTSLDPQIQAAAVEQSLSVYGYRNPRAFPVAVVEPGTGRILSMAVNRHFSLAPGDGNTVNQLIAGGGGVVGYSAGSTFKMFTMLAALSAGYSLDTSFNAPARLQTHWPATGSGSCGGRWCPANAVPEWMDGKRTMWTGFGRSVNTYFAWLEEQVGTGPTVAMARRLGMTFRAPSDAALAAHPVNWGAFTIGVADTTPLDLAEAYATLAANGTYCAPLPVTSITDADGHAVPEGDPACRSAVSPALAAAATDAARCPVGQQSAFHKCDGGTATEVAKIFAGRPVAGKTGSAENNATETFVGYTPQVAAAGIAADPADPTDYVGADVAPKVNAAVAKVMKAVLDGKPKQDFPAPDRQLAFGHD